VSTIVFPDRASARSGPVQQALARAAAAAAKAPILGRARALRWRVSGDGADLFVRAEHADPIRVIDGGSALHHALVALAGQGALATCERLADESPGAPIASVHVTGFAVPAPELVRAHQLISLPAPSARPGQPVITPRAVKVLQEAVAQGDARLVLKSASGRPDVVRGVLVADVEGLRGWLAVGEALSAVTLAAAMERLTVHAYPSPGNRPGTVQIQIGVPRR
jgi:hypothetical protein